MSARSTQRPDSRASTTSATSLNDEDYNRHVSKASHIQHVEHADPEAALLQYQADLVPQQTHMYGLAHHQHQLSHAHPHGAPFPRPVAYSAHEPSYMHSDNGFNNQMRMGSVPVNSGAEMGDDKRRKGSAVTATNDKELREMLSKNEGRPLRDVAQEVIQKERTPMAEKTKQLFAMLWLRTVCKPAKNSVPRNRVYSQYANRCGTERVVPLNPASFGKLVRVIFPGIQTRRLGVRGESKYHYVDLALEDEHPNSAVPTAWPTNSFHNIDARPRSQSVSTQQIDFNNIPRLQADTAAFPANDVGFDVPGPEPTTARGPASKSQVFAYPDTRGMHNGMAESMTYAHTLRFPLGSLPTFSENESVELPSIQPYLPLRTDHDTVEALFALYRTHCTSLIDSIRFCKEKQFFRLYTSFHGTLTVPVQKLFTHPNLAPWIEQCDLVMYRTMVRFVSRLTLQAAPVVVINILSTISGNLHGHIAKTFASQPAHVLEAKLRPATVFAGLLHRLIRVNQSAHAAANLLTIDQNREQMWREWITMVNPKRVMEAELPDCGYSEVYKILTSEMRNLLEPLQAPAYHDDPYGFTAYNFEENGNFAQFLQTHSMQPGSRSGTSGVSTENVLDRWSTFISSLPGRFPQASARKLLHCISAVGTAALRDITIMNGLSYGHWWVLKIFVDEMALWMAEMGGFLEPAADGEVGAAGGKSGFQSPVLDHGNGNGNGNGMRSNTASRMSSASVDMNGHSHHGHSHSHGHGHGTDASMFTARFDGSQPFQLEQQHPSQQQHQHQHQHPQQQHPMSFRPLHPATALMKPQQPIEHDIDDSGIGGMSFTDDDGGMARFGLSA